MTRSDTPQARPALRTRCAHWRTLAATVASLALLGSTSAAQPAPADSTCPPTAGASLSGGKAQLLKMGTVVDFDPHTVTVGDAMTSVLAPVKYRLARAGVGAPLLGRPSPAIASRAGLMSIEAALLLLIGPDHRLVVDHAHRLVAVERMPAP